MHKIINICLLFLFSLQAFGQNTFTVAGTVYDEKGVQISGTNIFVKNKPGFGAITDADGKFSINVSKGDVLVFNFLGYENVEYLAETAQRNISISFKEVTKELTEVVVTGLGTQRKISVVGAISTIAAKDLQVPASSMANLLGGRVPGVISMQTSGEPGKNISEFWIRGIGTFGASQSALVLIDGLEGNLNSVDPADIESFSILKDASATAVYGVRGANGVVLVTTKRGAVDKLKINGRANFTIAELKKMPEYLGAYEYAKLANEARVVRGDDPLYSKAEMQTIQYGLDKDLYPDVDWQKEMVNPTSFQQTYYASAQGGGEMARYFLSLGTSEETAAYHMDKNSPYKASTGYNTYSYRTNLDISLTKTTALYFGFDGYLTRRKQPGIMSTNNLWQAQSQLTPLLIPTIYSTGQLPAYAAESNISPHVMLNYSGTAAEETNSYTTTLAINQKLDFILNGLKFKMQGAFDTYSYFTERRYILPELYFASSRDVNGKLQTVKRTEAVAATYSNSQTQSRKYHFESTLNYEKTFNEVHNVSGLIYYYMSDYKNTGEIFTANIEPSMAAIPKRYQGISSRLTYGYDNTYMIDINFGYTGSENFQAGRRFGFFPSVALGWVPTNYDWVREALPWFDFLKIRGSYGSVGNDKISSTRFPYLTIVDENASAGWSGESGITETSIGADNLMWENAKKMDIGVEGRLFRDKVSFVVDIFKDVRDGIFQPRAQIPDFVGLLAMPYGNVGKMTSTGADGNIAFTQKINKKSSFTIRGNFTYSKNMVNNWEQAYPKYEYQQYSGFPYGVLRGYVAQGLFRDQADIDASPAQAFGSKVLPGDIKYKDVNGDGIINTDDIVPLTYSTFPRLMYGFGGEYQYKNLTFGVLFKGTGNTDFFYVGQSVTQNGTTSTNGMGYVPFHGGKTGNVLDIVADQSNRWTPASYSGDVSTENPDARFPRLTYGYNANNSQLSTWWKGNSKYLRLQEITVNYNLKNRFITKMGLSSIDLQFVGSNLYVWDGVKLWDPEQANLNGRAYPIPVRYTFQIYINL